MTVCPSCGQENSPGAKFCSECGVGLLVATRPREERKVVTVLFADLVGFTAQAERLDPEDVRSVLAPYYARLRTELERFGGTVEKFIGDAVMALFGAPVAHEDDPERAVRAALAIRDWAREESNIQVRIGVNTGEALISLGARPTAGEGMAAGDVVNTAARMQAAAPTNGVLVGETTYRATANEIDYVDAEPISAKGKTEPVRVWQALEPHSRVSTEAVSTQAPLVGRRREVDQLIDAFERARQEDATSLVTVVGVPGIGKSRLVAELYAHVESLPDFVYWRHGRSLPYGEGVTFWALGEMVKAQAGILESDSPEEVERKLHDAVVQTVGESEQRWVEAKLRPLMGIAGDEDGGGERSESFSAWRTFFESLAEQQPLVMVFEDLHWAGDELLDFVDELANWIENVPLLVLCTARPELLDRRPGWGGGKRNAVTISVSPLDADDTARLIAALLDRAVLPVETQTALLARAGGNPLYAEQFVRMLSERGDDSRASCRRTCRESSPRGSIRSPTRRSACSKTRPWLARSSGLRRSQLSTDRSALRWTTLSVPSSARTSSGASDAPPSKASRSTRSTTSSFATSRTDRSLDPSAATSTYGRPSGSNRSAEEDQAELLAHHYQSALELARASGASTTDLEPRVRTALRAAGTRALALLAYAAAARAFEAAAELAGDPDPDRPRALLRHGLALQALLDPRRFDVLDEARSELAAAGDTDGAAEADLALAESWWWIGDRDRCSACLGRAAELIREGDSIGNASFGALPGRPLPLALRRSRSSRRACAGEPSPGRGARARRSPGQESRHARNGELLSAGRGFEGGARGRASGH